MKNVKQQEKSLKIVVVHYKKVKKDNKEIIAIPDKIKRNFFDFII